MTWWSKAKYRSRSMFLFTFVGLIVPLQSIFTDAARVSLNGDVKIDRARFIFDRRRNRVLSSMFLRTDSSSRAPVNRRRVHSAVSDVSTVTE